MKGTWQTDDHAVSGKAVLLVIAIVLLSSGAAAAISAVLVAALIALAVVVVLIVSGLVALVVYRARHPRLMVRAVPAPAVHQIPAPERPALEQHGPRELHLHFHGHDAEQAAEILRRAGQ